MPASVPTINVIIGPWILVVGGYGEEGGLNEVELISLSESDPIPDCLRTLQVYPMKESIHAAGINMMSRTMHQ